jgi:hypothetical protein
MSTEVFHFPVKSLTVSPRTGGGGRDAARCPLEGTVEDWVVEGYKVTRAKVYSDRGAALPGPGGARHTLSQEYVLEGAVVVEGRLTRAGLRLAQFLNETFKD